jgi:hypothetical protein
MNTWTRRAHLLLTLGGGFTGAAITSVALLNAPLSIENVAVLSIALAFYIFGVVLGIRIAEGGSSRTALLSFYGPQIPLLSSQLVVYRLGSGAHLDFGILAKQFYWHAQIGCDFEFRLMTSAPFGVGINILAVTMCVLAWRMPSNNRLERSRVASSLS